MCANVEPVIAQADELVAARCADSAMASFEPDRTLPWAREARSAWADIRAELHTWEASAEGEATLPRCLLLLPRHCTLLFQSILAPCTARSSKGLCVLGAVSGLLQFAVIPCINATLTITNT